MPAFDSPGITERLWYYSISQYSLGHILRARLAKSAIFLLVRAILPFECKVGDRVTLLHRGLTIVIHPNVTIGSDVVIGHGVTIGAGSNDVESGIRTVIGDGVWIGAGAAVVASWGYNLELGSNCRISANALVNRDVPAGEHVRLSWPPV